MRPSDSAAPRGTPIPGRTPDPGGAPGARPAPAVPGGSAADQARTPRAGTAPQMRPAPAPGAVREGVVPGAPAPGPGPAAASRPAGGAVPGAGADPAPSAAPRLALVWSAERDGPAPDAVRVLGLADAVDALRRADRWGVRALRECGGGPRLAAAVRVLGLAGEHGAVWLGAGLAGVLAGPERRAEWLRATAAVAGAHLVSMGLKRAVRRPRPHLPGAAPLVRTAAGHGFPSAHAASSTAAAVAYGALLPGAAAVPALAAGICVSRLVAGVHYPSDVAAGALLGGAVAWAAGGGRRG